MTTPHMPAEMQLPGGAALQEHWWGWRDVQVHLDRIEVPQPRGSVILVHGVGGYGRIVTGFGAPAVAAGYSFVAPVLLHRPVAGCPVAEGLVQ